MLKYQGEIRVKWARQKMINELHNIAINKHGMKLTELVKYLLTKEHAATPDKYKMHPNDYEQSQHGIN